MASDMELLDRVRCQICYGNVVDNRACARCHNVFCHSCLSDWLSLGRPQPPPAGTPAHASLAPRARASCPVCRAPDGPGQFEHDSATQALSDRAVVPCPHGCGELIAWGERDAHSLTCADAHTACPFDGCEYVGLKATMDEHTYSCPCRKKYSLDAILQKAANDQRAPEAGTGPAHAPEYRELLKDILPPKPVGEGLLLHFVQEFDTLSGLAIKYGVRQQELIKLNGLFSRQIHGHSTLLVPKPPNWTEDAVEYPPLRVVVALRKQRMVQTMLRSSRLEPHDAIAYLTLCGYELDKAMDAYKEDTEWGEKNQTQRRPRTLREFLQSQQERSVCSGCRLQLSTCRDHCRSCGKIFCKQCVEGRRQCADTVAKELLGVTAPGSRAERVPVCKACFTSLREQEAVLAAHRRPIAPPTPPTPLTPVTA